MKLTLLEKFTIEIDGTDEVLTGTLKPLTKKEQKDFEKEFDKHQKEAKKLQQLSRQHQRLAKKISIAEEKKEPLEQEEYDTLYDLEDKVQQGTEKLQGLDTQELTARKRMEMSVESPDMERILELAESIGYRAILDVISQDIKEKKGNDKTS